VMLDSDPQDLLNVVRHGFILRKLSIYLNRRAFGYQLPSSARVLLTAGDSDWSTMWGRLRWFAAYR
jgi:hypothetical protein